MIWSELVSSDLVRSILSKVIRNNICICPEYSNIFRAFTYVTPDSCKVVFLGQDPYPQKGIATGILFANKENTSSDKLSPSLKVVKNSLLKDLQISEKDITFDPTLSSWEKQGILMINSALTCELGKPGSHMNLWRPFTSELIKNLSNYNNKIIFVLFGSTASTFKPYINRNNSIIEVYHPAYYARQGGILPLIFSKINELLQINKETLINWI